MTGSLQIRELFKEYGDTTDASLRKVFEDTPNYELYGHMKYFMGLADEHFNPVDTYGGKRFRSSLCLMIADWLGNKEAAIPVATSVELFHNFTLIHDDIVDGDTLRRGRKTVWNIWGEPHAINSGDVQAMLAYQILTNNDSLSPEKVMETQAFLLSQYIKVGEGQYLDFVLTDLSLGDEKVNEAMYFDMISRKTAALIAAATKAGGMAAGATDVEVESLYKYGLNLGIAYQLCDDTVSIWGRKEQTGKREFGDVFEKKKTFPVLWAYKHLGEKEKERLATYYSPEYVMDSESVKEVVGLLDSVQAYDQTTELVKEYADKANKSVANLSITEEQQQTLSHIVDALLPDIKKV